MKLISVFIKLKIARKTRGILDSYLNILPPRRKKNNGAKKRLKWESFFLGAYVKKMRELFIIKDPKKTS